jgi:hypothetical protein
MKMGDEHSSVVDVSENDDEGSTIGSRSNTSELVSQHGRDVGSYESHCLAGHLKIREDMIVEVMRHLDDTHEFVAIYCWRAIVTHDS